MRSAKANALMEMMNMIAFLGGPGHPSNPGWAHGPAAPGPPGPWRPQRSRTGIWVSVAGAILAASTSVGVPLLYARRTVHEVELRAGPVEGDTGRVRYQVNEDDVQVGHKGGRWKHRFETRDIGSIRLDASEGWCEIRIDGRVCDREEDGGWCACYDGVGEPRGD